MAGLIDPTVTGKYPVVLGEGLLGGNSNDIFTGIKYNHKPPLSSGDAPEHARLKPSLPGKTSSYDLSFMDGGGGYAYAGTRNTDDNQYVLHFDAERKVFVLDKIDSTFNMNLTRLPTNTDPDSLSRRFPHLEVTDGPKADAGKPAAEATTADTSKASQGPRSTKPGTKQRAKSPIAVKEVKRKPVQKKEQNSAPLNLPTPQPEKKEAPPKRKKQIEEDEEDEDDDDGGLTIEYPGADLSRKRTDFSPAFPSVQRFDDFMDQRESEGDDADGESDSDMEFKLPSPVNPQENKAPTPPSYQHHMPAHGHGLEEEDDDDLAADLEKDLENAFEDLANSNQGTPNDDGDESEISEED